MYHELWPTITPKATWYLWQTIKRKFHKLLPWRSEGCNVWTRQECHSFYWPTGVYFNHRLILCDSIRIVGSETDARCKQPFRLTFNACAVKIPQLQIRVKHMPSGPQVQGNQITFTPLKQAREREPHKFSVVCLFFYTFHGPLQSNEINSNCNSNNDDSFCRTRIQHFWNIQGRVSFPPKRAHVLAGDIDFLRRCRRNENFSDHNVHGLKYMIVVDASTLRVNICRWLRDILIWFGEAANFCQQLFNEAWNQTYYGFGGSYKCKQHK